MSRFLRFCAFLSVLFFTTNVFAAGYSCPTYKKYTSCNAGYYMTVNGTYNGTPAVGNACTICPKGYYCTGTTANRVACPAGRYGSTTGLKTSTCTGVISAGRYGAAGATSASGSGAVSAGYYSTGGGTSATPTAAGSGCLSSYTCGKVSQGCYTSGTGSTKACPNSCVANATTSSTGATSVSSCICKAGYGGSAASTTGTCTACSTGYYKSSAGNTSCSAAGTGYYVSTTASTSRSACTSWRANTSTTGTTSTSTSQCLCKAGYYLNGSTCTACSAGSYKSAVSNATSCTTAGSGYYVSTTGATSQSACTSWRANTNTNGATGSTSTSACVCKAGTYLNGSTCTSCSAGTYKSANSNATSCTSCTTASGWTTTTSSTGSTAYTACYQTRTPANCASGTIKRTASSISGTTITYGTPSVTSALSSNPGYYVNGTSCTVCANGKFYGGGTATSCTSCPSLTSGYSYVSGTGWTSYSSCKEQMRPTNCYSGYLTKTATSATTWGTATNNITAKGGYKVTGSGDSATCSACGSGSYSANGATSCTACPTADSGWTVSSTSSVSTTYSACFEYKFGPNISSYCSGGRLRRAASSESAYSTTVTIDAELQAKAGAYVNGQTCTQCSGAEFSAGGTATSCTACPAQTDGWTRATGTGWDSYTDCYQTKAATAVSSYCYSGRLKQIGASATTWATATVSTAFTADKGSYVTGSGANTTCSQCAAGTYQGTDGSTATSCSACTGRTKYSAQGAAACSDVGTGYYTTGCDTSGNNCTGRAQCSGSKYCVSGVQNTCPSAETNWTLGTGTGWSAVTSCFETRDATNVSSYCSAGQLKKNATSSATWPTSATISTALQAKAGAYVNGQTCTQCSGAEFSAGGTATSCTACPAQTDGWTRATGTGWDSYTDCYQTKAATAVSSLCESGQLKQIGASATTWATATVSSTFKADPGAYVTGSGASTTCSTCTANYYCPGGTTTRQACSALTGVSVSGGSYTSAAGSDASTDCKYTAPAPEVPTYCATKTSNTVTYSGTAWPTSTYSVTAKAGSIISDNNTATATCSQCTGATYSAGGTVTTCSSCDSNYQANTTPGKSSATQCQISCGAGQAVLEKNAACAIVTGNNYKTGTALVNYGSTSPTASDETSGWEAGTIYACPSSYSISGTAAGNHDARTDCTISCDKGTQVVSANAACTTPSGTTWYTAAHNVSAGSTSGSNVNSCNTGYATANTTTATDHDNASDCKISCSAGYYIPTAGAGCKVCPAGKYCSAISGIAQTSTSDVTGTVTAGYYSSGGATSAKPTAADDGCLSGYSCGSCSSGTGANGRLLYSNAGASSCSECPAASDDLADRVTGYSGWWSNNIHNTIGGCYANFSDSDDTATFRTLCYYNSTDGTYGGTNSSCQFYKPTACSGGYYSVIESATEWSASGYAHCKGVDCMKGKVCGKTDPGYYSADGATTQTQASAGYYAAAGASSQTKVTAGCYTTATGSSVACPNSCADLGGGLYKNSTAGSDAATDCYVTTTAGKYIKATTDTAQTTCPSGDYCPAKTLYWENTGGNIDCPGSYTAGGTGLTKEAECKISVAGGMYVGTKNSSTLSTCAGGTYKAAHTVAYGSTSSCATCSAGYYCPEGASGQTECGGNTKYSSSGASECSTVSSGYYSTGGTTTTRTGQTKCEAGNYCTSGVKTACSAGTYQPDTGKTSCLSADKGYYVSGTAETAQTACAGATYQNETGKTSCKSCPTGYTANTTSAKIAASQCQISCAAGTQVATANAQCTTPSGNWYTTASQLVNYGSTSSVNACDVATNLFNPSDYDVFWGWVNSSNEIRSYATNAFVYIPVEPNTTYIVSGMDDATTASGRYVFDIAATPVAGGTVLQRVLAGAKGKGMMITTGATAEYLGVFVLSDNDGASTATREAKVEANVANLQIFKASDGYGIVGNATTDHDAAEDCKITCGPGQYVATEGSACVNADAGYYATGGTVAQGDTSSQTACGGNTKYSAAGASECSTVSTGYYTTGGTTTTRTGQSQCTSGTYCTGGEQKTCPSGYGASAAGSDAAADCYMSVAATKYVAKANDSSASACGTGTYKASHTVYYGGTSTCNSCPSGYDDGAAASAESGCIISVAGGMYVGTKNSSTLSTCECGTYKAQHSVAYGSTSSCTTTSAGYYAAEGAATQTKASAGYYAAAGACDQTKIQAGCFGGEGSASACPNSCPAAESGWTLASTTGLKVVTDCAEITTPSTSGSPIATICTAGTLTKKATNATTWGSATASGLTAKAGRYVNGITCSACAAGTYTSSATTATSCTPAAAGYYVSGTEATSQTPCGGNTKYSSTEGATNCSTVSSGYYTTGGTSTTRTGQSQCTGATYCTSGVKYDCPEGYDDNTTNGKTAASSCQISCDAGARVVEKEAQCTSPAGAWYTTAAQLVNYGQVSRVNYCMAGYTSSSTAASGHDAKSDCVQTVAGGKYVGSTKISARYIKVTTAGSTANANSHVVEIQAFEANNGTGTNLLSGKGGVSGSNMTAATDGSWSRDNYASGTMVWDMGSTQSIGSIKFALYTDGRVYSDVTISVSTNNSTWTTVLGPVDIATQNVSTATGEALVLSAAPANCAAGTARASGTLALGSTNSCPVCGTNKYSDAGKASCSDCATSKGYTNSGTTAASHAGAASCKVTCGAGQYVASAGAGCVNVGVDTTTNTGYWGAGGTVSQTATLARNKCDTGLITTGSGTGANEAADCGRKLHAGDNVIYLRSAKRGDTALNVKIGNQTFFGALSTTYSSPLKVKNGSTTYSVVNDWQ